MRGKDELDSEDRIEIFGDHLNEEDEVDQYEISEANQEFLKKEDRNNLMRHQSFEELRALELEKLK